MAKTTITHTVKYVSNPDDGMADFIQGYEADGWAVRSVYFHLMVPEMTQFITIIVFEKEVNIP